MYTVLTLFLLCALCDFGAVRLRQMAALAIAVPLALVGDHLHPRHQERIYGWWLRLRVWGRLDRG